MNGKLAIYSKAVETFGVSLHKGLDERSALAQIFGSDRDTSLLHFQAERVDIKKLFHAEPFSPARIGRRGKAGLDGPPFHRRDNLRQAAHLDDGHVCAPLQSKTLKKNGRAGFAQGAKS